jgi:hypothetical protein
MLRNFHAEGTKSQKVISRRRGSGAIVAPVQHQPAAGYNIKMKAGDLIKLRQTPDGRYLDNFLYIYNDTRGSRWESIGKCFPGDIGLVVDPKVDNEGMLFVLIKEKFGWVDVGYIQNIDGEYLVEWCYR